MERVRAGVTNPCDASLSAHGTPITREADPLLKPRRAGGIEDRMRVLSPRAHGFLDYVTVLLFAVAPSVLHLSGVAAGIAYALAAVHLLLTLVTSFPAGALKLVPLPVHGAIEIVVAVALIALPFVAGFTGAARPFFAAAGLVILIVWFVSAYGDAADRIRATPDLRP